MLRISNTPHSFDIQSLVKDTREDIMKVMDLMKIKTPFELANTKAVLRDYGCSLKGIHVRGKVININEASRLVRGCRGFAPEHMLRDTAEQTLWIRWTFTIKIQFFNINKETLNDSELEVIRCESGYTDRVCL